MTPIAPLIEAFLDETLARQRGVSRHTRDSYALSFQLLFMFAAKRLKVSPSALTLEQLDAGLISAFLEYLEDERDNAPVTRNVRLAAIKSFFRFLEIQAAGSPGTGPPRPGDPIQEDEPTPGALSAEGRVAGRARRARSGHA